MTEKITEKFLKLDFLWEEDRKRLSNFDTYQNIYWWYIDNVEEADEKYTPEDEEKIRAIFSEVTSEERTKISNSLKEYGVEVTEWGVGDSVIRAVKKNCDEKDFMAIVLHLRNGCTDWLNRTYNVSSLEAFMQGCQDDTDDGSDDDMPYSRATYYASSGFYGDAAEYKTCSDHLFIYSSEENTIEFQSGNKNWNSETAGSRSCFWHLTTPRQIVQCSQCKYNFGCRSDNIQTLSRPEHWCNKGLKEIPQSPCPVFEHRWKTTYENAVKIKDFFAKATWDTGNFLDAIPKIKEAGLENEFRKIYGYFFADWDRGGDHYYISLTSTDTVDIDLVAKDGDDVDSVTVFSGKIENIPEEHRWCYHFCLPPTKILCTDEEDFCFPPI